MVRLGSLLAIVIGLTVTAQPADNGEIDGLLYRMQRPDARPAAMARLQELGSDAVPRLVAHVRADHRNRRVMALSCLQYVWSPDAVDAVADRLEDRDGDTRRLAMAVLRQHEPELIDKLLEPLARSENPAIVASAVEALEPQHPDVDRLLYAAGHRPLRRLVARSLSRYHDPKLGDVARDLLRDGTEPAQRGGWTGAIWQFDDSDELRRLASARIQGGPEVVRDLAAEYLRWHGTSAESGAIERALQDDADTWTRASLEAALAAIAQRAAVFAEAGSAPTEPWPTDAASVCRAAAGALRTTPTRAVRQSVLDLLRTAEPFTPYCQYGNDFDDAAQQRMAERGEVLRLLAGDRDSEAAPTADAPVAERFVPPMRGYFDADRRSYGEAVREPGTPFSDSVHIGDDAGWHEEHATVVAIAAGRVVFAKPVVKSWGGLVIIEHDLPDGAQACSLYGHLGPLLTVREGDVVRAGQKIGALGRAYTHENGGYGTHLHFGVHTGPAGQGEWITGYLRPARFRGDEHGWVDPQGFVRERVGASQRSPAGRG